MVNIGDVEAAEKRIGGHIRATPCLDVDSEVLGAPVTLKLEQLQRTGAFKIRGALNALASAAERNALPEAGVIAASGGNHGLGVAYAARLLGVRAEIFVPTTTPKSKLRWLEALNPHIHVVGANYAEALDACRTRQDVSGALSVHAYDQAEVIAGQGTLARELPQVDTVLVAVGGGGLSSGITIGLAGRARVVTVEPASSCALHAALERGEPVDVHPSGVAADALGATRVGTLPWEILHGAWQSGKMESILVEDEDIVNAQHALWDEARVIAEPGGATAAAGILAGAYVPMAGERVAVLICGGNTTPAA